MPRTSPGHILCGICRPAASYPVAALCGRSCTASRSSWAGSAWAPGDAWSLRCRALLDARCVAVSLRLKETVGSSASGHIQQTEEGAAVWGRFISWQTAVSHYRNYWSPSATEIQGSKTGGLPQGVTLHNQHFMSLIFSSSSYNVDFLFLFMTTQTHWFRQGTSHHCSSVSYNMFKAADTNW